MPPIQPVQQQQPTNFDFTQNQPQPPAPAPVVPQPDSAFTQLQTDMAEIKATLGTLAQPPAPVQQPAPPQGTQPEYFNKKYDDWGVLEQDTKALVADVVESKLQEAQQQNQTAQQQVQQQEQQNQQYIDSTVNQLRQAGYLPPVANQFDTNDLGKQAENELIGYAVYGLGSTDLAKAASELKFRHDAGYKFDPTSKQFVRVNQPSNDPNGGMFGNLPATPDQPMPNQFPVQTGPFPPQYPQQPVGPQNPWMPQQYPAGFNAPVSSGNSYQGTQGATPSLKAIRTNSYDALVDNFNRTQ